MDLKSWYRSQIGEIAVYKARNLDQTGLVNHCFTTKMNLALHIDDNPEVVIKNRERIASAMGFNAENLTCAEQIHGNAVAVVKEEHIGRGSTDFEDCLPGVDALITNCNGAVLSLFYADCVPVFIVDPFHKAIGLAHSGWKGTALSIAAETINAMTGEYGTNPADCIAAIGPAIGRCCYDVSNDVAMKVYEAAGDDRVLVRACRDQWRLDLKLANWFILKKSGIAEANIAMSAQCTSCEADDFFSYRRDGATGRMAAVIALR